MSRPPIGIFGTSGRRILPTQPQDYLTQQRYALQRREGNLTSQSRSMQRQINNQSAQIKKLQRQLQQARRNNNSNELQRLEQQLKRCEEARGTDQSELDRLNGLLRTCREEQERIRENLRGERKEQKQNVRDIAKLEENNKSLEEALRRCEEEQKEIEALRKENEMLKNVGMKSDDASNEDLKKQLEECKKAFVGLGNKYNDLQDEYDTLIKGRDADANDLKAVEERLSNRNKELERLNGNLQRDNAELKAQMKSQTTEMGSLRERLQSCKMKEEGYLKEIARLNGRITEFMEAKVSDGESKHAGDLAEAKRNFESELQEEKDKLCRELEEANKGLRQQNKALNEDIGSLNRKLVFCKIKEEELNKKITQLLEQRAAFAESKLSDSEDSRFVQLQSEVMTLKRQLNIFNSLVKDITAMQQKAQEEKEAVMRKLQECEENSGGEEKKSVDPKEEVARLKAMLDAMKGQNAMAMAGLQKLRDQAIATAADAANARDTIQNQRSKLSICNALNSRLNSELEDLEGALATALNGEADAYIQMDDLEQRLNACQEEIKRLEKKAKDLRDKLKKCKAGGGGASKSQDVPYASVVTPVKPDPQPAPAPALTLEQEDVLNNIREVLRWYALKPVNALDPQLRYRVREEINWIRLRSRAAAGSSHFQTSPDYISVERYREQLAAYLKEMWIKLTGNAFGNDSLLGSTWYAAAGVFWRTPVQDIRQILTAIDTRFNLQLDLQLVAMLEAQNRNDRFPRVPFPRRKPDPYDGGGGGGGDDGGGGDGGGGGASKNDGGGGRRLGGNGKPPTPAPGPSGPTMPVVVVSDDDDDSVEDVTRRRSNRLRGRGFAGRDLTDYFAEFNGRRNELQQFMMQIRAAIGQEKMRLSDFANATNAQMIAELRRLERKGDIIGKTIPPVLLQPRLLF